ncbi:MAG: peptidase [Alphaproteobacteria bacterium]|nr:peptidase [Alphaproteobacteria bacterium]
MRTLIAGLCVTAAITSGAAFAADPSDADKRAALKTYADIAEAAYADALSSARDLRVAVNGLIQSPRDATLLKARDAWLVARPSYQQTEVYRFGNRIVDEWEGKVNAWPLDEGLIDYVSKDYAAAKSKNPLYAANVIANRRIILGAKVVDASTFSKEFLSETLHEFGKEEANVATGYHAIEFLLWGQDLNGTGPGAGNRPWTDFSVSECTNGNCDRRAEYLRVATELLVADLAFMAAQWTSHGAARAVLMKDPAPGLAAMLRGMGSLSYGELAGERMKLGLMLHDPEEEHDCFSDNTHNSHYYNVVGIRNVYHGRYVRRDGSVVSGPSLSSLVAQIDQALDKEVSSRLEETEAAMIALKRRAETIERYDQMIGRNNAAGNAVVQAAIDRLSAQTRAFEKVVARLGLRSVPFEGSDSLDDPAKVFQ